MNTAVKSLEEMENLFSNTLPIEQLIFLELRDCDLTAGTPLYEEKVKTLIRTVESHHKATSDKQFVQDMKNSIIEIKNPATVLHNSRCTPWNIKKVKSINHVDFEKQHSAGLNFLARRNITFKEERTAIL